jgi:hypothetical protein
LKLMEMGVCTSCLLNKLYRFWAFCVSDI